MHRPNTQEFVKSLLETLDDLPPDFVRRFEEILATENADRSQAIRQLFEELTGE
jgi:metal-responsive CopG/Arc/MetJ family transcriptional regulator